MEGLELSVPGRVLLSDAELSVGAGEAVAVMGPSGSGKTSFVNVLAGIRRPSAGRVVVAGCDLFSVSDSKRAKHRLRNIGMIFQFGELLPELTVSENVALPLRLTGVSKGPAAARTGELLDLLGVAALSESFPETLSGGETQRVGIARALAHSPKVLLADEPTGALDEENATTVVSLLTRLVGNLGVALVMATHDPAVADRCHRIVTVSHGRLVDPIVAS
ncbi:ABC transporter ATP-binding protein [Micromonospora sp. WMMD882]|uniref:ABC transporter ATP-binding protein n=1 Tax=Micromonospora sp. WMMD882 TaxID=3015151 RepID=UPI00248C95B9|nr:ABC transporter ATP-binding protein [Micromonospora sp. WMMD882]WBB82098.1 ABC transporter ATP-binding protein [Micromonospora sp. WMMD882]